ncbi:hypothetical protein ABTZ59_12445 [Streptomyces sp. NPDC094034]|uniref:hypothetical protein n=1 Tax=Streptomyces sp. NPDC094034 TaxID=3155309 RepID=UPI00331E41E8
MPTASDDIPDAENPGKKENPLEEAVIKATMAFGMASMSAGLGAENSHAKSAAFGLLAVHSMEKSLKEYKEGNYHEATVHALTAIGTGLRSGGMAADSQILNAAGPALNSITHLTSAGIIFLQGKEGWRAKVVEAAEMASFSFGGGYTSHPVAMSLGWGLGAAGFLIESKGDKGFLGHAVGAGSVATGWAMKMNSVKSLGAAVISTSELLRLWHQFQPKVPQTPLPEAAPHQPHIEQFLPSDNSAHTAGSPYPQGDPVEGNPVARAANRFTAPTSPSGTDVGGVTSAPSQHGRPAPVRRHSV